MALAENNTEDITIRIMRDLCGWKWFTCDKQGGSRWLLDPSDNEGYWRPCTNMTLPIAALVQDLLPNITESLDACYSWLVPEMNQRGFWLDVAIRDGQSLAIWMSLAFTRQRVHEHPAMAICLAIESYLDAQVAGRV